VKANDIEQGTIVRLRNGWQAVIQDNARGNTRIALVYVLDFGCTLDESVLRKEVKSVYSHDIIQYRNSAGLWENVDN